MERLKIFVSAYACEPGKGSEIGVGWHWVLEMSRYFELWVMTRANNQEPVEEYFAAHPEDDRGIHWVYYDCPDYIRRFKHQMRGVRTYYTIWQYGSDRLVRQTMQANGIKIFHLLTYGNALWHVSSYGQRQFFVWGPTGGLDTIPAEFSRHYALKHRLLEAVRRLVVGSLWMNLGFRRRCKNADLILCKAHSTLRSIPEKYRHKAMLFTDVAMETAPAGTVPTVRPQGSVLTFITVGRLDGWRGFDILVESFAQAAKKMPDITLKIIGDGAEREHLRTQIAKLCMEERIILTGQIPMEQYRQEMQNCDAVVNACLKEGGVTNAFDCMTWGKPLLCIDTGGYTRNLNNQCAIILPHQDRAALIESLKEGILQLCSEERRRVMSEAMIAHGAQITWAVKGQAIRQVIENAWNAAGEE